MYDLLFDIFRNGFGLGFIISCIAYFIGYVFFRLINIFKYV